MSNPFFDHPILNSPYVRPLRHWELDADGQPTQKIIETRRRAEFITPIHPRDGTPAPALAASQVQQCAPFLLSGGGGGNGDLADRGRAPIQERQAIS
jgi:hypothetical protein